MNAIRTLTAGLLALCGLLAVAAMAHADPSDDAQAALAIASAAMRRSADHICACTSFKDCSCKPGTCICPQCNAALEWRRYADGDASAVMLWDKTAGRQVGCYSLTTRQYQPVVAPGQCGAVVSSPIPTPLGIEEVAVPVPPPAPVTMQQPMTFAPQFGGFGGCASGG